MKQEVFVIGADLRALVPYSQAFIGSEYAVTLVEAADVVRRATTLARQHDAWFLLLLDDDEDALAFERKAGLDPLPSLAVNESEDPVVAVAHLIALAHWDEVPAAVREAEEQYG